MTRSSTNRHPSPRSLLYATLLCAVLLVALALPAAAQTPTPTTTPAAGTPAVQVVVTPPRPVPTGQDLLGLTVVILGFAIGAVVAALLYSYNIQIKYYDAATRLGVSGVSVKTSSGGDFGGPPAGAQADDGGPLPVMPVITGPTPVVVGVQSGEFSAAASGGPLESATWRVEPPNMAVVMPPTGADKVKVIAAMPGVFKLYVSGEIGGAQTAEAVLDVAAVAAQRDPVELPFVGRAYGSVVLGIILTAAVILLALAGLLSEAVVVALLTSLLGYTFGVAVANRTEG